MSQPVFPPRAAKRDDVLRAMDNTHAGNKSGKIDVGDSCKSSIRNAEWFDFGRLDDTDNFVTDLANDARPFLREKLVTLPFPDTVFRARIKLRVKGGNNTEFIDTEFVQLLRQPAPKEPIEILSLLVAGWEYDKAMVMAHGLLEGDGMRVNDKISANHDACRVEASMFLALWLVLNTKGISKMVSVPDAKLNKARARTGKMPLRRTTYVSARHYVDALRETELSEKSGRASPRMHLRRAHLRRLGEGRFTPIHAMIISGAGGLDRDKYRVTT